MKKTNDSLIQERDEAIARAQNAELQLHEAFTEVINLREANASLIEDLHHIGESFDEAKNTVARAFGLYHSYVTGDLGTRLQDFLIHLIARDADLVVSVAMEAGLQGYLFHAKGTIEDQIVELLKQNQKIPAIKLYRENFRVGLKEAKEAVEDIGEKFGVIPVVY